MRKTALMFVIGGMLLALPLLAQTDPLSGTWAGDWGPSATHRNPVTVQLKWDGKALSGTVNPGPNAITLQNTSYDAKTGAVKFEAHAPARGGAMAHFVIDGKVANNEMTGSWSHDGRKGDFKVTKK